MRLFLRHTRHFWTALHDMLMAGLSFYLALTLRLGNGLSHYTSLRQVIFGVVLCAFVSFGVFYVMRLYRGLWRYTSIPDLIAIVKSVTIALLLFYLALFICNRLEEMPRSVPFIQWLLLIALLGAPRFAYRIWRDRRLGLHTSLRAENRIPVLLIGSGERAELFLRDTRSGASAQYVVVGMIDDKENRIGRTIHNVRIYGNTDNMPQIVEELAAKGMRPQRAILTYDTLDGAKVRHLLAVTEKIGLPLARLPRLSEFKQGMVEKMDIRPIAVEDLLGRAQNVHDKEPVRAFITGKVVLVTGSGGTIGSELTRQIADLSPSRLIMYELSEYALYQIDMELSTRFPHVPRTAIIGDVKDRAHLDSVFAQEKPEVVFHAAAIKHVPLAEANPEEAVLTNLFGTQCVAEACAKHHALVMVMISTDKAVNPSSLMGATKRAAESYCQALGSDPSYKGKTRFVTVRFGNVLGSTGSVIPLFQQQLARGGPLTVTHPEMVRYFMTVREAVELVMQSATLSSRSGEIYVLDMGQPVRILDLAEQMVRLAGLKPHQDIKIEFTGLRPGEKMFEELFHFSEEHTKTAHESIWLANPRHASLKEINVLLSKLQDACLKRDTSSAIALVQQLVPEYTRTA
ncbi:MAG TPA: nucleoside-diphosphate sugar epimerase/dehydratase [Rickettsiales bacterium]|nr:nucleoside-diphosphate sugar epimerase/dehydratase [Rickettsiales bacterium]